jgi:type IX secretion system PorP/SprF family membrane protein
MRKLLIIILITLTLPAYTQVQLTQYFQDGTLYNPAVTGSYEAICTNIYGRQQWIGLTDSDGRNISPTSFVFSIHSPIYSINSGLGMNIVYDNLGKEQDFGVKLNYAYQKSFKDESKVLGIGIGISLLNKTIFFDQLTLEQPNDPLMKTDSQESGKLTDLDFGIQYRDNKKFIGGISLTNLFETKTKIGNVQSGRNRNLYITTEYYFKLLKKSVLPLYIIPSMLLKSNLVNMQIDFNTRAEYKKMMAGISYRYQDAVAFMAGLNHMGFRVGVSYDLTLGNLRKVSNGSVEVFLGYCYTIRPKVKMSSLYNTRYL